MLAVVFCPVRTTLALTDSNRWDKIKQKEALEASMEAKDRKARSITILKKEGVPYIDHLSVIEDSSTAKKRTKEEIAKRAIAVCLTAVKGEGIEQPILDSL